MMMMMTREDTMGSNELEMSIRSNYALVPSYSEALLMECTEQGDPERLIRRDGGPSRILRPKPEAASSGRPVVSSSGELRSYGAVAASSSEERDSTPSSGVALGYGPRRLRRSYCEAVYVGNGSSLTIDRRRSGGGRSRRSLVSLIAGGGHRRHSGAITASVSSPDSIAARTAVPDASDSAAAMFDLGRPGSWNGIPHPPDYSSTSAIHRFQSGTSSSDVAAGPLPVELPPSYELALNMEPVKVVGDDVRDFGGGDDDVVSVSTTSTYVMDSVHVTPRHQMTRARRTSCLDVVFVSRSVETTI